MQKHSQKNSAVTVIGAAFVAASIVVASSIVVSPAVAQNSATGHNSSGATSNYALLQQIRNLQQEVAELRDRVDRQEYAMQRLKSDATVTQPSNQRAPTSTQQAIPLPSADNRYPNTTVNQNNWPTQPANPQNTTQNGTQSPAPNAVQVESIAVGAANQAVNSGSGARVEERDLSGALPINPNAAVDQRPVGNQVPQAAVPTPVQTTVPTTPTRTQTIPQPVTNNTGLRVEDRVSQAQNPVSNQAPSPVQRQTAPVAGQSAAQSRQSELLRSGDRAIKTDLQEEDLYARGLEQLKKQQYELAVSVFNSQLQSYPRGQRSADAYYWIGESLYILENLDSAKKSYNSILTLFPSSRRVPNALFKVAVIENDQGNQSLAKATLQSLLARFPNSAAAAQAKARLADLL